MKIDFGLSGVRVLPVAAGTNISGQYCWHFVLSSSHSLLNLLLLASWIFRGPYFSTRKKTARVLKFCMGLSVTERLGFQKGNFVRTKGEKIKLTHESLPQGFKKFHGLLTNKNIRIPMGKKGGTPQAPKLTLFLKFCMGSQVTTRTHTFHRCG